MMKGGALDTYLSLSLQAVMASNGTLSPSQGTMPVPFLICSPPPHHHHHHHQLPPSPHDPCRASNRLTYIKEGQLVHLCGPITIGQ